MTSCTCSFLNGTETWPTLKPFQVVAVVAKSGSTYVKQTVLLEHDVHWIPDSDRACQMLAM